MFVQTLGSFELRKTGQYILMVENIASFTTVLFFLMYSKRTGSEIRYDAIQRHN